MPELPEVETTKQGITPHLQGHIINEIVVRNYSFRIPVPTNINELCTGKKIVSLTRRAKYILIELSEGYLLIHLGMSGHLRIVPDNSPPQKHDHISLILANGKALRFSDPRRFGLFLYVDGNPLQHSLLVHLGPEPFSAQFNGDYLFQCSRNKNKPIKSLIMDNKIVVGIGNIYATESLFLTQCHPNKPARNTSEELCHTLATHIKEVLRQAIKMGGTTLRDFYAIDGKPGYFTNSLKVYGRKNQSCWHCNRTIATLIIGGRSSAFCPGCQK